MNTLTETFDLAGKWALVTGASRGLGKSIAKGLAEAGASVVLVATDTVRLNQVAAEIRHSGRQVHVYPCDLRRPQEIRRLFQGLDEMIGGVDILVNSAGSIYRSPAMEYPESKFDEIIQTNLTSVFIACQEAAKRMCKRGGGKIVNVSSVLSISGGVNVSAYAASKGGVSQLTKALANEWASQHINVNGLAPGYFVTDFTQALRADRERHDAILARIPAGRWGTPEDIIGAAVFLASRASDYMHGHILVIDGGWTAW